MSVKDRYETPPAPFEDTAAEALSPDLVAPETKLSDDAIRKKVRSALDSIGVSGESQGKIIDQALQPESTQSLETKETLRMLRQRCSYRKRNCN